MSSRFGASEAECIRVISEALHKGDIIGVFDEQKRSFFLLSEDKVRRIVDYINAAGRISTVALDEMIRDVCMDTSVAS
jgi:uncharacterized protein YhbP (UPF0306 family)